MGNFARKVPPALVASLETRYPPIPWVPLKPIVTLKVWLVGNFSSRTTTDSFFTTLMIVVEESGAAETGAAANNSNTNTPNNAILLPIFSSN
jgi:hypothetical protein